MCNYFLRRLMTPIPMSPASISHQPFMTGTFTVATSGMVGSARMKGEKE
jgi:hypothetical protein